MAITTRSERSFDHLKAGSTVVGPGDYDVLHERRVRPGFVGFASSDYRDLNPNHSTAAETPGPGSYTLRKLTERVARKGPNAGFSSTSQRTLKGAGMIGPEGPGPGTYIRATSQARASLRHRRRRASSTPTATSSSFNPPAIPDRCVTFGYDKDGSGRVFAMKNPLATFTGLGSDTVGPAFYNPTSAPVRPETHCCVFSRLASKRMNWIKNPDHPGPGSYSLNQAPSHQDLYVHRGSSSFETRVRRNSWELRPETQDVGPGAYKDYNPAAMKPKSHLPGFMMSSAQHTLFAPHHTPGPGSYESRPSSFKFTMPLRLTHDCTGFGTARRPCLSQCQDANITPGPALYDQNHETIGDRVRRKAVCEHQQNQGPFGSSSHRFAQTTSMGEGGESAEDMYNPLPPDFRDKQSSLVLPLRHLGAFSRDRARRVSVIPEKIDDVFLQGLPQHERPVPGVGTYELRQELAPSHFIPSKPAKGTTSFSTAQRFRQKEDDTPGPGWYASGVRRRRRRVVAVGGGGGTDGAPSSLGKGERFRYDQDKLVAKGPAPGDYSVAISFNRKSFNITFNGQDGRGQKLDKQKRRKAGSKSPSAAPALVKGSVSRFRKLCAQKQDQAMASHELVVVHL